MYRDNRYGIYCSGRELATFLEEMIENTQKWLIILSPFIRISGRIKGYLENLLSKNVEIIIIHRTNFGNSINIQNDDKDWLINHKIQVKECRNLHAKCYINEECALLTSINLYDSSLSNNFEMGVVFYRNDKSNYIISKYESDEAAKHNGIIWHDYEVDFINKYQSILDDILSLNCDGETINFDFLKYHHGYCIRTGKMIPFNIDKPMCDEAWEEWCEKGDPNVKEEFCHYSGEKSNRETSVKYPIMRKNYWQACEDFSFDITFKRRDKRKWKIKW